ncbi:CBS domain-containing protein [Saccharopolyspora erythraea]|uniref:CBS domain-containing protein n=1 Tax=Saccharopolyspora erythraea TaxID=1836 RepID=UPI001BAE049E|nr:CBS domain-containing protein [Saccharopolyspora erythraea]QUH03336.1 CBS domain-containing protein [Saccharopolyspora erythraea]
MHIAEILSKKGSDVATIRPAAAVSELLRMLAHHNIGAMAVVGEGEDLLGIVSERDIVRRLDERGAELLTATVAEIMTTDVITCAPTDTVEGLTEIMTERRVRHLPVVEGGALVGIVSIGDVVKSRIDALEQSQEQLESYITQG